MRRSPHKLYGAISDPRYVEFVDSLPGGDARWTTERIEAFLREVGNPHHGYSSILVAGTNGKGGVASAIYGALRQRYRTGLFTSPHVVSFRERVRVDDCVPESYIRWVIDRYGELIETHGLTYFEFSTALAFLYFRDRGVRAASVEVGLGGEKDATNVVMPLVSVITYVDYDHLKTLGPTLRHIAEHKAGIIKGAPLVTYERRDEVLEVFSRRAREVGSEIYRVQDYTSLRINGMNVSGMGVSVRSELTGNEYTIQYPVPGTGQSYNVAAAILALELAGSRLPLSVEEIERGLPSFTLPGRFQMLRRDPPVILDGAHNVSAVENLVETLMRIGLRPDAFVISLMRDKRVEEVLSRLSEVSSRAVITEVPMDRCLPVEEMRAVASRFFEEVVPVKDVAEALRTGMSFGTTVITGSFYLVGEVLRRLGMEACG